MHSGVACVLHRRKPNDPGLDGWARSLHVGEVAVGVNEDGDRLVALCLVEVVGDQGFQGAVAVLLESRVRPGSGGRPSRWDSRSPSHFLPGLCCCWLSAGAPVSAVAGVFLGWCWMLGVL